MANAEPIRLLAQDLRTTTVPQGHGLLRSKAGDCCLARACDVFMLATGRGRWVPATEKDLASVAGRPEGVQVFEVDGVRSIVAMPAAVVDWFGMNSGNPHLIYRSGSTAHASAADLNDGMRLSFPEIADAFERTYLGAP